MITLKSEARYWIGSAVIAGTLFAGLPALIAAGSAGADGSSLSGDRGYGNSSNAGTGRGGYRWNEGPNGYHMDWDNSGQGAARADRPAARGGESDWYICRAQATWCRANR